MPDSALQDRRTHYAVGDGHFFHVTTSLAAAQRYELRGLKVEVVEPIDEIELGPLPVSKVKGRIGTQWYRLADNQEIR